ncbi:PDZ and LIM domain protein Zasp isoform X2 [Pararge aegeria]|uniref:PDZ and LIM domain protein Zasp isoform X2 n=1 Tax=Pararge aegeria TaxID=116150 RepID=UPI0019D1E81B|nr:PDZ and LIM domain protein Zasp isoform X2 [Pararge aegeria]
MAQLITVRLNKSDQQPLGFRLQGGKDFGTPLVVQKVNGGGAAERAGLQAGDALIRVNTTDVYTLRHQEAQDTIRAAGPALELTVQRGGGTWRPAVTPTGSLPRPGSKPLGSSPVNVTNTSLKATPQPTRAFGSGHNNVAKPFGYMNGSDNVKSIVNKQYNTPVNMYSDKTIAETLSAQTEVLAGGVLGVNFKKNEKTYDSEKSAVFKVLQEAENDPEPEPSHFLSRERVVRPGAACVRACVPAAPARLSPGAPHRPSIPVGSHRVLADGRVTLGAPAPAPPPLAIPPLADTPYCCQCNRYIDGVFVRIKDKNLHVECFKCATCGSSLKNQGYYNLNGKLYCDIHAKLVARQNPPAANLEPVTVSPGGRIPTNTYSTPLPPLSTNNYTNGSSSMFSPSSNLSGPKPFGSSIGSAYSPASLSPRSAPMSPARPLVAQAPAPAPAALSPAIPASTPFAPKAPVSIFKDKNKKSIVWPPPFPPEDEPLNEINSNNIQTLPCSEIQDSLIVTPKCNLNSQIKSSEQDIQNSRQNSEYSSNTTYETAITSATSSKSESLVQSQQSQSIKDLSTCTVQSFSQAASSHESQSFSIYQTHEASELDNNTLVCENQPFENFIKPEIAENQFIASDENITKTSVKEINSEIKENFKEIFHTESKYKENTVESNLDSNTFSQQKYIVSLSEEDRSQKHHEISGLTETNVKSFINSHSDKQLPISIQIDTQSDMALKQPHLFKHEPKPVPLPFGNRNINQASPSKKIQTKPFKPQDLKVSAKSASKEKPSTSDQFKNTDIVRGSLAEALTIAPDRPYSPFAFNIPNQNLSSTATSQIQPISTDSVPPPTISNNSNISMSQYSPKSGELSNLQKAGLLQSSSELSAFKPVSKQTFPPPPPSEFSALSDGSQFNSEFNQFSHIQEESLSTQSNFSQNLAVSSNSATAMQGFSTIKTEDSYSQKSNKQESTFAMVKSGFQKPEMIPPLQQNIEQQLQFCGGLSAMHQPPVAPIPVNPQKRQNIPEQNKYKNKMPPSSMTFQPVMDETMQRNSPVCSRPTTPSLINKPAPIIPPYQMNLVTMEHLAPQSRTYSPVREDPAPAQSRGTCRSPSNLTKVQAPRIKEPVQYSNVNQDYFNKNEIQNQPPILREQRESNVAYQSESYNKGDMKIKEDTMFNQNYGQRQSESQNFSEYGDTTVQTTRKTYEEFERAQSAKVIEIQKGGPLSSGSYHQVQSNIQPSSNISTKQVYPPTVSNMIPSQQNLSFNNTNENVVTASKQAEFYQPIPLISGANQGPVCDPTPSTGSSVGAASRGKAFGVSSAPKRGRGVLNKAALPGSRVPLCGSCNGNIRGPFITALGRIWCPEHFICVNATCRRQLQDIGFVEENGQLYCEYCFEQYIAPACDKCHAKIKGDCLNAIGKHFHPECFSCVYCGKLFGNNPFFLEDGLPYCEADWNELFTTKCFACGFPVEAGDRWVEALNNNYHSQCFNCTVCKKNLEGQSFFAKGGRPFCKIHAR